MKHHFLMKTESIWWLFQELTVAQYIQSLSLESNILVGENWHLSVTQSQYLLHDCIMIVLKLTVCDGIVSPIDLIIKETMHFMNNILFVVQNQIFYVREIWTDSKTTYSMSQGDHSSLQCEHMHDQRFSKYTLIRICHFEGKTPLNRNLVQFCCQILPQEFVLK